MDYPNPLSDLCVFLGGLCVKTRFKRRERRDLRGVRREDVRSANLLLSARSPSTRFFKAPLNAIGLFQCLIERSNIVGLVKVLHCFKDRLFALENGNGRSVLLVRFKIAA